MIRALFALVVLSSPVLAQDLTGHWESVNTRPDGSKRVTSLWLNAKTSNVSGYQARDEEPPTAISEPRATSGSLSYVILTDDFGTIRKTGYSGQLDSKGELRLIVSLPNGGPTRELKFTRVSQEQPPPMPKPAAKISLPPAKSVPSNHLAQRPFMGWNSWNKFAGRVSDQLVRETADAMATNGMKEAGYGYVNIDDTWQAGRDGQGNPTANSRFPDMKALTEYVHSKGLKIGIYSSPGPKTCANYEGSFGHEEQDARQYAAWGFDLLKYDWCSGSRVYDYHSMQAVYAKMGEALLHSGRPIVYSLCQYGVLKGPEWGAAVGGNSWRTTGDIQDNWQSMSHIGFDLQPEFAPFAGPGHWNDPDMLEVGNGGMTDTEYRTHMSLWSLLAAPLLAGNDLRHMSKETAEILLNRDVIAINQDPLGKIARRVAKKGDLEVWARPLADGSQAVGLFNRGANAASIEALWSDLGLQGAQKVRDLWVHQDRGVATDHLAAEVASHGVVLVKLTSAGHS